MTIEGESGMIKRSRVRIYTFGLLLSVVSALSELAAGQQLPTNPQTLVQFAYLKTELPSRRSSTCIAVLPDGRFHLEKRWRETVTVGYGSQVFEGTLSDERLRTLEQVLAADDLKNIRTAEQLTSATYEAEFVQTAVPRPEGLQYFSLVGLESLPQQHPRPLPDAVKPVVQWFHVTSKEIEKQRALLLKNGKTGNCGLPNAPEW
jgi:hypothetical protein